MKLMISSDVYSATHIIHIDDKIRLELISVKYGFNEQGRAKKPSEGLFGCITVTGRVVDGFQVWQYWKESGSKQPPKYPDLSSAMDFFEQSRSATNLKTTSTELKPFVAYDWFDSQRQE